MVFLDGHKKYYRLVIRSDFMLDRSNLDVYRLISIGHVVDDPGSRGSSVGRARD